MVENETFINTVRIGQIRKRTVNLMENEGKIRHSKICNGMCMTPLSVEKLHETRIS